MALLLAYGSLLADRPGAVAAALDDHVLDWGVAMDNAVDLPGYKAYLDPAGGRPAVLVCYLDVSPRAGAAATGGLLEVDDADLAALDVRERNYARRAVRARTADGAVTAWTYLGLPAARERAAAGRRAGTAVLHAAYLERVRAARAGLGLATPGADVPARELRRIEL